MVTGRTYTFCPPKMMLFVALLLMNSGCLRALGIAHSSLTPRTASVDRPSHILRSQDGPATDWTDNPNDPRAGNSRVRLLMPLFGHAAASAQATRPQLPVPEPSRQRNSSRVRLGLPSGSHGHSFGRSADSSDSRRNEQQHAVTEQVHDIHPPEPPVVDHRVETASSLPSGHIGRPVGAAVAERLIETPTAAPLISSEQQQAKVEQADDSVEPSTSVFDRLRGFYEPSAESDPRNILRRQIRKLQSPWSVFRNQEEPPDEPATAAITDTPTDNSAAATDSLAAPTPSETLSLLDQLIADRQQQLQKWPRSPGGALTQVDEYSRLHQELRLLYLIANESGMAISSISELPGREQDFWQELMLALAQYRSADETISDEQRLSATVAQLRSAARHLATLTALSIRRMEICSTIFSFGRVETFPSNDFEPGSPVLVYAEVDNFGSRLTPAGSYRTSIDARIQFLATGNTEPLETIEVKGIQDEATSERRDYFQSFQLNIPSYLANGRYQIRLMLTDRITGKTAEETIDFRIVEERFAAR